MAKQAKKIRTLNGEAAKFIEIDPATLSQATRKVWDDYKAAYAVAKAAKAKFEALMQDSALKQGTTDATTELFFGYNFGKLSIGVADKLDRTTASRKAVSFASLAAAA